MYHLFNSIYVDSSRRIDRTFDVITISKEHGFEHVVNEGQFAGSQLYYAQSLNDIDVEEFLKALCHALAGKKRTMIYLDSDDYLRLYALLIKIILPGISLSDFRFVFICKKALFDTTISASGEPRADILGALTFDAEYIDSLYEFEDPLFSEFSELIEMESDGLSLEWRVARLKTEGKVGLIPKTLKNIIRRIALSNAHDALEVWGRHITNEKHWEFAGIDAETLFAAPTVFEACVNLPHLASRQLLSPGLYDFKPNDKWLISMLTEAIGLMERLEDDSSAQRACLIRSFLQSTDDLRDHEACLKLVQAIFNGENRIALASRDTGKYDENLIRFILNLDDGVLIDYLEGATW